jgi:AraC-like DNA-binding protein
MRIITFHADSGLGRWTHHTWQPPHLRGVVDQLWHFEGKVSLPRERTFPAGYLEIILQLGPRFRAVDATGRTAEEYPDGSFTALQLRPLVIEAPESPCRVLGIQLSPLGAYALFGPALAESVGMSLDLADLCGSEADVLVGRCRDCLTVEGRFAAVDHWVSRRIAAAAPVHAAVRLAAELIGAHAGSVSMESVRSQVALGRTRFIDAFRQHFGVAPKQYARLLRFRHALGLLQSGMGIADAALAAGYFDQPHMNRDFVEFGALTPGEFIAARRFPISPSLPESAPAH